MAAQRERILVAAGLFADAEQAGQGFKLVGQRDAHADVAARQLVAGEARLVVVLDGEGDVVGKTVVQRVVAPHDALQFGELADHVGEQVGLGQERRLVGFQRQRLAADALADGAGDRLHPRHAFALSAELVVVDDLGQPQHARIQRLLAVLVEEELGVGEARAHHAFVALDHGRRIVGRDVGNDEEAVGELAFRRMPCTVKNGRCILQQGEIFLVRLHGQDQAFLRHLEEGLLELAEQHVGTLDQRGDLVQQRVVLDRLQAQRRGGGSQLPFDLGTPFGEAGNHRAVVLHLLRIAVGMADIHRADACLEAMALRLAPGLQAQHRQRHDLITVQRDQAVHRAHEMHAAPAVSQLIGHHLRDRQLRHRRFERVLQAIGQGGARRDAVVEQCLVLAVARAAQLAHRGLVGPQRGQALQQCRRGLAVGVEADAHRHQLGRHRLVGGTSQHVFDMHTEATRRSEIRYRCIRVSQPLPCQAFGQCRGKSLTQLLQRLGRQFFDEEFDEQVFRAHAAATFFSVFSI